MDEPSGTLRVVLISTGTTRGQALSDERFRALLAKAGIAVEIVRTSVPPQPKLLIGESAHDVWEAFWLARSTRNFERGHRGEELIYIYSTAVSVLLQPRRRLSKAALRFDALTCENRLGIKCLPSHLLERRALRHLKVLLPMSSASGLPRDQFMSGRTVITMPPPLPAQEVSEGQRYQTAVLAYAGNPSKKGLDLIVHAWKGVTGRHPTATLTVVGIPTEEAEQFLALRAISAPERVRFAGLVSPEALAEMMGRCSVYLSAPRFEDFGMSQLEALAHGMLVVTTIPFQGFDAGYIAETLDPELVVKPQSVPGLVAATLRALSYSAEDRTRYAERATELVGPYTEPFLLKDNVPRLVEVLRERYLR